MIFLKVFFIVWNEKSVSMNLSYTQSFEPLSPIEAASAQIKPNGTEICSLFSPFHLRIML